MPTPIDFMHVRLPLCDSTEVMAAIDAATPARPVRIATINPEFMVEAQRNRAFAASLTGMSHCLIDGFGLYATLQLWQSLSRTVFPLEHRPGADLVADLFRKYQTGEKRFFLLGGPLKLVEAAQKNILKTYPGCHIVGIADGGVIDPKRIVVDPNLIEQINASQPDILLVGFGAPKQELWIEQARHVLPVPVMVGVGGTLGFYGSKKRAGRVVRRLKFEWLHRGITETGHWKRIWRATAVYLTLFSLWSSRQLLTGRKN
ncbi:WecB/TagA/CpsF family glycosyltransferase [Patescibacteria group bacterium]|nr:WecB/TagA/CpsF family glycosyltransferase [Patescibacteria group bacterium]